MKFSLGKTNLGDFGLSVYKPMRKRECRVIKEGCQDNYVYLIVDF